MLSSRKLSSWLFLGEDYKYLGKVSIFTFKVVFANGKRSVGTSTCASSNTETAFGVMGEPGATFSLIPGSGVTGSPLLCFSLERGAQGVLLSSQVAVCWETSILFPAACLTHHIFISISIAVSFPPRPSSLFHPISNAISIPSHPLSHPHSSSNLHPHLFPTSIPIPSPILSPSPPPSTHLCSTPSYPIPFPTPSPPSVITIFIPIPNLKPISIPFPMPILSCIPFHPLPIPPQGRILPYFPARGSLHSPKSGTVSSWLPYVNRSLCCISTARRRALQSSVSPISYVNWSP